MKKIINAILSVFMLFVVASCNSSEPAPPVNTINVAALSAEQQDIIGLFSIPGNQELMIFDFTTDESFSRIDVWVEVYESGVLVDRPAGLVTHSDSADKRSGRVAIIISQNDNIYKWTL